MTSKQKYHLEVIAKACPTQLLSTLTIIARKLFTGHQKGDFGIL